LKKKERDDSDKFDAELETIYVKTKKQWEFFKPSNLEAEITRTVEAQRHVAAQIQATVQDTEKVVAKLRAEDDGKLVSMIDNHDKVQK